MTEAEIPPKKRLRRLQEHFIHEVLYPDRAAGKFDNTEIYSRLIHNIFHTALIKTYPLASRILGKERWSDLVKSFIQEHTGLHPALWQMPQELIAFVESKNLAHQLGIPYLVDLLRFEWLESYVYMMPNSTVPAFLVKGDLEHDRLLINPDARIISLEYPVFRPLPSDRTLKKGDFQLLLFRHRSQLTVKFIQIHPLFAVLIVLLEKGLPLDKSLNFLQQDKDFATYDPWYRENAPKFLKVLKKEGMILGFLSGPPL